MNYVFLLLCRVFGMKKECQMKYIMWTNKLETINIYLNVTTLEKLNGIK